MNYRDKTTELIAKAMGMTTAQAFDIAVDLRTDENGAIILHANRPMQIERIVAKAQARIAGVNRAIAAASEATPVPEATEEAPSTPEATPVPEATEEAPSTPEATPVPEATEEAPPAA